MLATWGVGQVLWSLLWFFLFFMWIWLVIAIFADILRSHDLGGWGKALWSLFVIFLPFLGVLVYLIVRGHSMSERSVKEARDEEQAFRKYVQETAGSGKSAADQLATLADLHDRGKLTDDEYNTLKAKALA